MSTNKPKPRPSATVTLKPGPGGKGAVRDRGEDAPGLDFVELMHDILLDGSTYELLLQRLGEEQASDTAMDAIEHFVKQMKPESPAEKLLASQMLLQHAHIVSLLRRLHTGADARHVGTISGAINAAMDVFRRQTEAWSRIRKPHVTVQALQANMAYQQVIGTGEETIGLAGTKDADRRSTQGLPIESGGPGVATPFDQRDSPVGIQHRATDQQREAE